MPVVEPSDLPVPVPKVNDRYTFALLFACVLVGVLMGLVCAIAGIMKVPRENGEGDGAELDGANGSKDAMKMMMSGIPLTTLTNRQTNSSDFRECFERAMKARHLPAHESLLIINPKEIVLSKIIGDLPTPSTENAENAENTKNTKNTKT